MSEDPSSRSSFIRRFEYCSILEQSTLPKNYSRSKFDCKNDNINIITGGGKATILGGSAHQTKRLANAIRGLDGKSGR